MFFLFASGWDINSLYRCCSFSSLVQNWWVGFSFLSNAAFFQEIYICIVLCWNLWPGFWSGGLFLKLTTSKVNNTTWQIWREVVCVRFTQHSYWKKDTGQFLWSLFLTETLFIHFINVVRLKRLLLERRHAPFSALIFHCVASGRSLKGFWPWNTRRFHLRDKKRFDGWEMISTFLSSLFCFYWICHWTVSSSGVHQKKRCHQS